MELSREQKLLFNEHVRSAKALEAAQDKAGALVQYRAACALHPGHASLLQKIAYLSRVVAPEAVASERRPLQDGNASREKCAPPPPPLRADAKESRVGDNDDDDDADDGVVVQPRRGAPVLAAAAQPPTYAPTAGSDSDDGEAVSLRSLAVATTIAAAAPTSAVACAPAAPRVDVLVSSGPAAAAGGPAAPAGTSFVDGYTCYVGGLATLPGGFGLPRKLFERLYPYQRAGVAWMWSLHADADGGADKPNGGILADDMGLGKTAQSVAFVCGLLHSERASTVLIGAPLSVMGVWEAEFKRWAPEVIVTTYHGAGSAARERAVATVQRDGGVLLTTHDMIRVNAEKLGAQAAIQEGDEGADDAPRAAALGVEGGTSWDVFILDEGHKIKNPSTAVAKAVRAVPARYRLLLTGTPVQNSLEELWALVDYATTGRLLGPRPAFKRAFADAIVRARDRHATDEERAQGHERARALMTLVAPHLLRREKEALLAAPGASAAAAAAPAEGGAGSGGDGGAPLAAQLSLLSLAPSARPATGVADTAMGTMGRKVEVALWAPTAGVQLQLYTAFLGSRTVTDAIRELSSGGAGFAGGTLAAITALRKIACHPVLLGRTAAAQLLLASAPVAGGDSEGEDAAAADERAAEREWLAEVAAAAAAAAQSGAPAVLDDDEEDEESGGAIAAARRAAGAASTAPAAAIEPWDPSRLPSAASLVALCPKLRLLAAVVRRDVAAGHRVLVFSQWKRMLDVIEPVLRELWAAPWLSPPAPPVDAAAPATADGAGVPYLRIDGDVAAADRGAIVARFNAQARFGVCLLTTGVGSLGLTLTGADRVLIYDGAWNPATDAQAVDRAYRVGQTRDVLTYRLIGCGAVEEKMYRLQVHKGGLATSVMGSAAGAATSATDAGGIGGSDGWTSARGGAGKWSARLLTRKDYKELFTLGSTDASDTRALLLARGLAPPPVPSASLAAALAGLGSDGAISRACVGVSHHDSLFRLTENAGESVGASAARPHDGRPPATPPTAPAVAAALLPSPRPSFPQYRPAAGGATGGGGLGRAPTALPRPKPQQSAGAMTPAAAKRVVDGWRGPQGTEEVEAARAVTGGSSVRWPQSSSVNNGGAGSAEHGAAAATPSVLGAGLGVDDDAEGGALDFTAGGMLGAASPLLDGGVAGTASDAAVARAAIDGSAAAINDAPPSSAAGTAAQRLHAALAQLESGSTSEQAQLAALESAEELGWLL